MPETRPTNFKAFIADVRHHPEYVTPAAFCKAKPSPASNAPAELSPRLKKVVDFFTNPSNDASSFWLDSTLTRTPTREELAAQRYATEKFMDGIAFLPSAPIYASPLTLLDTIEPLVHHKKGAGSAVAARSAILCSLALDGDVLDWDNAALQNEFQKAGLMANFDGLCQMRADQLVRTITAGLGLLRVSCTLRADPWTTWRVVNNRESIADFEVAYRQCHY